MRRCDVLVVGAGPAGLSAAYFCASNGLRTVVVEQGARVGEYTAQKIDASPAWLISDIVSKYSLPIGGVSNYCTWHAPSGDSFTMFSESGEYYFIRGTTEDSYESKLYMMAIGKGVRFIFNVKNIEFSDFGIKLHADDGNTMEINPEYIIGADGHNSIFHKHTDVEVWRILECYGVLGNNFTSPEHTNVYFDPDILPGGYLYMVTDSKGRSCAGAVVDSYLKENCGVESNFVRFINEHGLYRTIVDNVYSQFSGTGKIIKIKKRQFDNVLLVGDAGGFLDPIFGYGVSPAILSAYICFNTIYGDMHGNDDIRNYDIRVSEVLDYSTRFSIREIFERLNSDDISCIIRLLDRFNDNIQKFIEKSFI